MASTLPEALLDFGPWQYCGQDSKIGRSLWEFRLRVHKQTREGKAWGGARECLGAAGYNVRIIDLTDVKGGDPLHHFSAGSSPSVVGLIRGMNETGPSILDDSDGISGFFSENLDILNQGADLVLRPRGGR